MERSQPDSHNLLHLHLVGLDLIRAEDVGLPLLSPCGRLLRRDDTSPCFRNDKVVSHLDSDAEEKLDPEIPLQGEIFLYETPNNGTDD